MNNKLAIVSSFLGLLSVTSAQFLQNGQCDPTISLQSSFNADQFAGSWYEIRRSDDGGYCSDWGITRTDNTNFAFAYNSVVTGVRQNQNIQGSYETGSAKFTLANYQGNGTNADFWILGVNYQNYAIVYRCENVGTTQRNLFITLLGREKVINPIFQNAMNNIVTPLGISLNDLTTVDHSEEACDALPSIPAGLPVIIPGQCDRNISLLSNFNPAEFVGTWFEMYSYYSQNALGSCNTAQYSLGDGVVNVVNSQVVNQNLETISGTASVVPGTPGMLRVTLEVFPGAFVETDLWIIDTDYANYVVSYSCENLPNNTKQVFSWIASRRPQLSVEARASVNRVVSSIVDLNFAYYEQSDQSADACFYLPEPSPDTVVEFRGECDLDIPAVPQFDPVEYMGLWHDIEAYPTSFQGGQCNNAYYTLRDGVVDVFNTQVINQKLDTIDGEARLVSDDGSGKLAVTFPIVGTNFTITTSYWVLATDYRNYSLVYTCQYNSETDIKEVFSWKLSRSKSLTAEANAAMNAVIANIPVLNQMYYLEKDQSPEACFYYPEPLQGVPVIFPGVCDQNINAVPNFQLTEFVGDWNEIETYPKDQVGGQCIKHSFTTSATSNTTLLLTSNQVFNSETLVSNSGDIVLSSTDGSGRFLLSMEVNNQTISIPYWVIDTDYTDYALIYSCMDRDDDTRAVYSWKLSRSTALSNNATTAIATAMAAVDVLDQQYYESVSQTDDSCFYLPETGPQETVIFPGQCDPNIPVVQNFSAADYLGLWHLVETYHSEFQVGECNDATYSLQDDGSVLVFNTEVANQRLMTITGRAEVVDNAKLNVTFPDAPFAIDYWILDTDYTSFALVYTCVNLDNNRQQVWSWKMSRTRSLTTDAVERINQKISEIRVLDNRYYRAIDNSDQACFYFPEPNGQPVTFRGRCDESIPVVTNFNASAYMGTWYDIERYPQRDQFGTCGTATYTLSDVVDVFNTEVINQRLSTITGTGVPLPSDNGEAKLEVTFPIEVAPNVTVNAVSPYWVLTTDYTDYALVYACQNIGSDRRSVSSWKLSRTKSLSTQAQAAINSVTQGIDVLRQDYYEVQGHTDEDCFYYPNPNGEPVIFRGQCDNSIQAIPNFNLQRFVGDWNEIETYPKDQVGGQCIKHSFTTSATSNTTLLLTSNQVFNSETLVSNSGDIVLSSTDGSGRFLLSMEVNNQTITIPYWVIDTDYTDYALVYSCMDRDDDTRAVYSWKLSRSTALSNNATTAIATAMAAVDVLDQQYYELVSQTDDSCFYLPETGPQETVIFPGQCDPNIPVVQNFSAADYLGLWHLVETYHSDFQVGECNDATYSLQDDGSVLVFNTEVADQRLMTITGRAEVVDNAKLNVTFPDAPFATDYWILDTDYTSFALVYTCVNLDNNRQQVWSWKMSRTRSLTTDAVERINQKISEIRVLDNRYYRAVDNSDQACFYFPEPNGQPVTFRGRCDESIPVVTNFNASAYMGTWYDIERYPQRDQFGTCGTATYTLSDVVDVFNTEVINQRLSTITGTGVPLPSDNGEAKLEVTFPIEVAPNVTVNAVSPYWVLTTDYTDYALVYACQNIGSDRRSVSSWKLSRTKSLSTQAQAAINNVTQGIDVLRQDYYEVQGHTDEDCFYYPNPNGEPVIFRGQCDNSIQAIPNFNLQRFIGDWNEIETYPKDQAGGQCIKHSFTTSATSNTTLLLTSNQVFNSETLVSNSGDIVLSSTDGSGRFLLSMEVNNQTISIPYWVIDTDYTDYALVYSCMDRDDDTRAVYSWKLSRSTALSSNATTAIATAMAAVDVLDQQYYESVSQTDDSCFYLPETGPQETVIFPGQCDPNISVVQNFSAADYLGLWHLVETYHSEFQVGECNDATYSLQDDGSVLVFNTEVANQRLMTITGRAEVVDNAKLNVTFPDAPFATDYWILDTDYTSFALVYTCVNLDNNRQQVWSWKMSRTRSLTTDAVERINQKISEIRVLDNRYYRAVDNSDEACFYFPEPNGQPVTFRGRCDESIPVVTNFNASAYMGTWYDIERYPQRDQFGTCGTATYTLGDVVNVFNTEVINQRLSTITGTGVPLPSDNGEAKLEVTFPIEVAPGVTVNAVSPYWVLATDYTDYALVYACQNIGSDRRSVSSWKLSRTKSLSTQAQAAINNVTQGVDVLRQDYYEVPGHTDEDCFFYPDNNNGPVILDGQCPNSDEVDVVSNFNLNSFRGTWHEVSRFPSELQTGDCASGEFEVSTQNSASITQNIVYNERLVVASGTGTTPTDGRGVISVSLSGDQFAVNFNMYVLDTDYNEFALLYACRNVNNTQKQIYSWKLSRSRSALSQAAKERINAIVSNNTDLFELYYDDTKQTNAACFYYPEFDVLPSVIQLPGPCDDTIRGVSNFNATAYLGRWLELARYPQPFQFGACDQATYALGDNVVDVYNTQVVNRTLLIQEGFAEVASTDGTGQLQVTFNVNGIVNTANYFILATDYFSYSLVYSCRNLPNGNREVYSWKLSRDRTLSEAANQTMSRVIEGTQGLLEEWFTPTSQSDEDCFYVPEPNPDSYVLFRGQCGDISGMANFRIQDYLGVWHEIERYPTGQDDGVCTSADFSSSGNQFQVVDTSVYDLTADISTSTVTVTNDGRIRRTSGPNTTDVWVLATDYTTYALLYSCEDYNDEYRRVWSAKHSRTRNLTAEAELAIKDAMAASDVLYQEHYLSVEQSNEACFYYPEVTGRPVVLPGQCDPNIPVQQTFSFEEYSGNWYQIERYPQMWETGNCTGARYTINADGNVDVLNWQVIDGELDTIEGTAVAINDDGSGKVRVTLPSRAEGAAEEDTVTMDLYVLKTDYVTYSLTYSCVNINEYQRQLGVWKLSRTRALPAAAATEINTYMADRRELDQRYFVDVAQDEECEEPSSGYFVQSSIILLLVCSVLQLLK